jgi:Predicted nucleic acid-binding protein, contains PIN domain
MKLLDSSVLVDIDRGGVDDRVATLDDTGRHAISMVTVTELQLGVDMQYEPGTDPHQQAHDDIDRLLARFDIVPITRPIATKAATVIATLQQDGRQLDDLHDVYIAATALTQDIPVVTANVDHFERIDGLSVVDWAEL